jgi:hypothetical protein
LREKVEEGMSLEQLMDVLRKVGGLSRFNIFDPEWHKKNKKAAMCLWGFLKITRRY